MQLIESKLLPMPLFLAVHLITENCVLRRQFLKAAVNMMKKDVIGV